MSELIKKIDHETSKNLYSIMKLHPHGIELLEECKAAIADKDAEIARLKESKVDDALIVKREMESRYLGDRRRTKTIEAVNDVLSTKDKKRLLKRIETAYPELQADLDKYASYLTDDDL